MFRNDLFSNQIKPQLLAPVYFLLVPVLTTLIGRCSIVDGHLSQDTAFPTRLYVRQAKTDQPVHPGSLNCLRGPLHYKNMPIQIYWKYYHQKMKIFR